MTRKKTLVNESVIRRWGKLANMAPLTENYLEEEEAGAEEMEAGAEEMEAGGEEMEAGGEVADPAEMEAVEGIVQAVVDAIAQETGVDIEVEGGADEEGDGEMEMDMEPAGEEGREEEAGQIGDL